MRRSARDRMKSDITSLFENEFTRRADKRLPLVMRSKKRQSSGPFSSRRVSSIRLRLTVRDGLIAKADSLRLFASILHISVALD